MKKNYVKKLVLLINACVTFTMHNAHTAHKWCIQIGYARSNVVSKSKTFRIRKSCIQKYEALKPIRSIGITLIFNLIFQQHFESFYWPKSRRNQKSIHALAFLHFFISVWMNATFVGVIRVPFSYDQIGEQNFECKIASNHAVLRLIRWWHQFDSHSKLSSMRDFSVTIIMLWIWMETSREASSMCTTLWYVLALLLLFRFMQIELLFTSSLPLLLNDNLCLHSSNSKANWNLAFDWS